MAYAPGSGGGGGGAPPGQQQAQIIIPGNIPPELLQRLTVSHFFNLFLTKTENKAVQTILTVPFFDSYLTDFWKSSFRRLSSSR
uniref:Uncharacterized protein n=1 Tax=Caenorhabditis japonica TaxID=281687 RepID=A0A8R1IPP9_CAEJA